jgi:hypothetical protein
MSYCRIIGQSVIFQILTDNKANVIFFWLFLQQLRSGHIQSEVKSTMIGKEWKLVQPVLSLRSTKQEFPSVEKHYTNVSGGKILLKYHNTSSINSFEISAVNILKKFIKNT